MSLCKLIPSLLIAALAVGVTAVPAQAQVGTGNIVITDVDVDPADLSIVDGVLRAAEGTVSGTIAGLPFTTGIEDFALDLAPDQPPGGPEVCTILHLELAPIDVDLLGLHVDTSAICLNLTAIENGGLLGDLLCGLAGGLDLNLPLDLGGIADDLAGGLPAILTDALNASLTQAAPPAAGAEDICDGECEVLDLAIGPVDLTLLGLNVHLDNCENGPVQVCVSASEGEGLLGDLLCGLAGGGILPDLGDLQDLIDGLAGLDLDALDNLSTKQIDKLVREVSKTLRDGELTTKEIDKLVKSVSKLIRKA